MLRYVLCAAALVLAETPGMAQSAPVEFESDFDAVTVVGIPNETEPGTPDQSLLYEISLDNRIEKVLENGLQIGGRLTLRGQRDNAARPGFLGNFDTADTPRGAYSGLSGQAPGLDSGARAQLEAAYLELDGGYGELRVGRDRGVAARFSEGAPSALSHARINNPYLDPGGVKMLRTNHDLTGPSAKVSYASPRILGLRAGASFTPEADADGLDRSLKSVAGQPELSNAFEAALNLSRRLRTPDVRIEAGLAWSKADVGQRLPGARESAETFSAGAALEFFGIEIGGSWLSSDNGFAAGDYTGWEIGALKAFGGTDVSLNYGESEDDLAGIEGKAFSLAVARDLTDELALAVAYQDETLRRPGGNLGGSGIVVEITLSGDFFRISAF